MPGEKSNDDLMIDRRFWDILHRNQDRFIHKNFQHSDITHESNAESSRFMANFLKPCFVYVITETAAEYPYPYFSEKTWKATVSQVPFMIVGAAGSIAKLREFGFRTFDQWWDEDYDALPTAAQRIEAVVLELKKLSALSLTQLNHMREEMLPVLQHNFEHMSTFAASDLANIESKL
jgi:hypothetical protein